MSMSATTTATTATTTTTTTTSTTTAAATTTTTTSILLQLQLLQLLMPDLIPDYSTFKYVFQNEFQITLETTVQI